MKKHLKQVLLGLFVMAATILMVPQVQAKAYGLTQTNPATDSITVSWEAETRATEYRVYCGLDSQSAELCAVLQPTQTSVTIGNLAAGQEYYVKVVCDYVTSYGKTYTDSVVGSSYDVRTIPTQVTGLNQKQWWYYIKSVDVTWDRLPAADSYDLEFCNAKGKKIEKKSVTYPSYSHSVDNTMIYTIRVRANSTICGQNFTTGWSTAYLFTQPRIKTAKVSGGKLNVKWDRVTGATGYDVYASTNPKKGYKKVKSVGKNATSATAAKIGKAKFNAKKTYYVYVVTKKKAGKTTNTSGALYYWNTKNKSFSYLN